MLYVVHCHRKLLYFNVSIIYIIYIYVDIAKNPQRTFLGLNREKNKKIKGWPKKGVLIKKSVCVSISGRACCHERNMCNHWPRSAKKPVAVNTAENEKA